jgi:hypothetical protein
MAGTQHIAIGNVGAWKSTLLAEPGTQIELPDTGNGKAATGTESAPEPPTSKTLSLPRKKQQ